MVAVDDFERGLEKDPAIGDRNNRGGDDDGIPSAVAAKRRIRYFDDEDEFQENAGPSSTEFGHPLKRHASSFSVHSLSSVRSGQRIVDPHIILPVQYRTLSYTISNTHETQIIKAKDAREKAAIGKYITLAVVFALPLMGL